MAIIRSLQQILTNRFGNLLQKNAKTDELNKIFQAVLDTDLSRHCHISKFSRGKMTLLVDNSSWATKLRYEIPDIIKLLKVQPEFSKLKSIYYQVNAKDDEPQPKPPKPKDPKMQHEAKKLHEFAKTQNTQKKHP